MSGLQDVSGLQEAGCERSTGGRMSAVYRRQDVSGLQEAGCQRSTGGRM